MNCNEIKEKMWDYLLNDTMPQEMKEHLAQCSDCNAEFEHLQQIIQNVKPKVKVCASENFNNNIIKKLKMEDTKMKRKIPFYMKVAAVILLLITPLSILFFSTESSYQASAMPANRIFSESWKEMRKNKSMRIELEIRTLEGDNFEIIGTNYDFVKHQIKVDFSSPKKWLIEKPRRTVLCDGTNQYLNVEMIDYVLKAGVNAGFVEWLKIFLNPDQILENEKQRSKKEKSEYKTEEIGNELVVTVFASAQGDYTNDYLKNKSVQDSDNKRIFRFDKETHQLVAFELYLIDNKTEILIMKTTDIKYNEVFDTKEFDVKMFGDKKIINVEDLEPKADKKLQDKTPEEIARYFFEACAAKDWEKAGQVCSYVNSVKSLGGLEIIEIGEHFKSGIYPGVFVPYTIKLESGDIKKHNIAIRNDNPQKMWMVDGGI